MKGAKKLEPKQSEVSKTASYEQAKFMRNSFSFAQFRFKAKYFFKRKRPTLVGIDTAINIPIIRTSFSTGYLNFKTNTGLTKKKILRYLFLQFFLNIHQKFQYPSPMFPSCAKPIQPAAVGGRGVRAEWNRTETSMLATKLRNPLNTLRNSPPLRYATPQYPPYVDFVRQSL